MADQSILLTHEGKVICSPTLSEIAGLIHGVTTREVLPQTGRVDLFEAIQTARELGVMPSLPTIGGEQVHGNHVGIINEPLDWHNSPAGFRFEASHAAAELPQTDALVATIRGVLLTIKTADCLPVFLVDPQAPCVGLAHCGWRGLYEGLAAKTVAAMTSVGADPSRILGWMGPCITTNHYEVGEQLVEKFKERFPDAELTDDGTHLNLVGVARWQLHNAGVLPDRIHASGECTLGLPGRYHSYRAEGDRAGRMLSFIGFEPEFEG